MIKRLPVFTWLDIKTANEKQVDGLYEQQYQVIGIDPRLGEKKMVQSMIHELLHYLSDTYPHYIKPLTEKKVIILTKQIFNLIKK